MKVVFDPQGHRDLRRLDKAIQERIMERLRDLRDEPETGKVLIPSRFRSLRIGEYRAIYEIQPTVIVVLFVGHRKNVYDRFHRFL